MKEVRKAVGAKQTRFIVLCVGDKDSHGYNEDTLPLLLQIVDASKPDARIFTHTGVVGYFGFSSGSVEAVESAVLRAEQLRDLDPRFSTLGIGLACGDLVADFDWLGRLKHDSTPMGRIVNEASAGIRDTNKYKEVLKELHEMRR